MKKRTRRDFLKASVGASLGLFLSSKMANYNLISQVHANELDQAFLEHKLISFGFNGGASKWYWDLPLQPNTGSNPESGLADKMVFNPMVITRYGDDIQGPGEYRTTPVGDYHMPEIWASNIPTPTGSTPMADLSENMLIMRGLKMATGGHVAGFIAQNEPIPGKSLLGLVADASKLPLPAVGGGAGYVSELGTPTVGLGTVAMDSVSPPWYEPNHLSVNDASMEARIDEALLALQSVNAESKHRFIPKTYQQRIAAKTLLKKDFSDLEDVIDQLTAKYNNLLVTAMHGDAYIIPGVEDRAIPGAEINGFHLGVFNGPSTYYIGNDLRECFYDMTFMNDLAKTFATAEFMMTEGYSASFNAATSGMANVNKQNFTSNNGLADLVYDIHDTGSHVALLQYTKMYKAYAAMLHEFVSQLKAKTYDGGTMFDKSLVTTVTEFNRAARMDGSGADHGDLGTSYTIMSGKVSKLTVMGDTTERKEPQSWGGSWGVGVETDFAGGRPLHMGNVSSTICTMLGADSITPNDPSMVRMENDKIVPHFKTTNNV